MNKIKMKQRDANMELLRLLAMLMVIVYHFFGHTFIQETINDIVIVKIVSGFVYIGVNIFVLISGFYGIRFSIKGIVSLCFVTAFYNLVGYLFHIWHGGLHFGKSLVLLTVFPISHTMAWFIVCYMMLYLLAPILNRASEYLNEKEFSYVLGLLTIVNVYFGYFWQNSYCSVDGYTVAQFVYIYMIGRFIKQYVPCDATRKVWMRKWLVTIYVGCSLLWGG